MTYNEKCNYAICLTVGLCLTFVSITIFDKLMNTYIFSRVNLCQFTSICRYYIKLIIYALFIVYILLNFYICLHELNKLKKINFAKLMD